MIQLRPVVAIVLLAVLAVGGTITPTVHRAAHAEETAETQARHADAGHHHHDAADAHGVEAVPPCPEPLAGHFPCVLCAAASAVAVLAPVTLLAPEPRSKTPPVWLESYQTAALRAYGARGPPVAA